MQRERSIYRTHAQNPEWETVDTPDSAQALVKQAFGDHNGLIGAVGGGQIHLLDARSSRLVMLSGQGGPQIDQIALAGNGRVAISLCDDAQMPTSKVLEFRGLSDFKEWRRSATWTGMPHSEHMLPCPVHKLSANATTFACVLDNGDVYTWGDARYGSLGRMTSGEDITGADVPGLVEALAGIKIVKMSSGGWMHAALSESGAAYVWGSSNPGKTDMMTMLNGLELAEVRLVEIPDESGEPLDMIDIAVGDGHLMAVAENGTVYSAGENSNGQLGVGRRVKYAPEWVKVDLPSGMCCKNVQAGPKSTFLKVRQDARGLG